MKIWMIAGIAIAGLGVFIMIRGLSYDSQRSVVRVGDFRASVEQRRVVPAWVGGLAILGGLVLVGVGVRRQRA
jgi:hypothetical protein